MALTAIEWTDRTWNPVTGCSKVSPGCAHCYAEMIAKRLWRTTYPPVVFRGSEKGGPIHRAREFTDVQTHEDRLLAPLSWRSPARVFVDNMSDLFHEDVPFEFVAAVFAVMAYCERHTFQVLTKRPQQMRAFMEWVDAPEGAAEPFTELYGEQAGQQVTMLRMKRVDPNLADQFYANTTDGVDLNACLHNFSVWPPKNVWLGVSVENQHFADERIPLLLRTPAAVRFISAEPLLEGLWLERLGLEPQPECTCYEYYGGHQQGCPMYGCSAEGIKQWNERCADNLDWVIVGGESGAGARPFDVAWARSIVQQCQAASVPVFVKQLGAHPYEGERPYMEMTIGRRGIALMDRKGGDPAEWPKDLRVREMP